MIGRQRTGFLSTNHMRAFSITISKAETGLTPGTFNTGYIGSTCAALL
jgi:hypothetical protein